MHVTVFQSDEGDCLLLTGTGDHHVLVDGGMARSFREHAAQAISDLGELEVVYVSHVDEDHISGVLQLIDDEFDWRVFEHRQKKGRDHPRPDNPRPPKLSRVWHNAFHAQVDQNSGPLEDLVIANAVLAAGSQALRTEALELENLATSIPQAIELSNRIGSAQLGLQHNEARGALLMAGNGEDPLRVGPLTFTIIGPFEAELNALRKDWTKFLEAGKNQPRLKKIREQALTDAKAIAASSADDVLEHLEARGRALGKVTVPNLASLMFHVEEEESGKTILLTGDGRHDTILRGLEQMGKMQEGGSLHVDVLKVPHHGALANVTEEFCRRVTADHYVFCGNGAHDNPEEQVVTWFIDSRLHDDREFKLWFNSHHSVAPTRLAPHMRMIEELVTRRAEELGGRMSFEFLTDHSFAFDV
ncbi:MAG TPA: MBL fold metallo-hydrolase [Thermoanaerobaculia bacterium]|nr:MBL fold metallo-hydrolase [Thermoanaerobaculia bacterium]